MSKDSLDPRIIELLKKKLNGIVSPHTIPSAISRTKEHYPFLTPNAAAEVYGSRYHVSVHKFLNEKDREALGTFAVGKTNSQTKQRIAQTQRTKTTDRQPTQKISKQEIKMEMVNKDWDVFICYKRLSAEDLAEAVKKILEECHFRAFLDIKDIPSKFKGTDEWTHARDNAVLNCKVFVLIMTAGFELSDEVKKELTLARSIPDKLFAYFRHKDLPATQKIVLERETLDLSKQQQYSFGTLQDLVRTAHKVLVADGIPAGQDQEVVTSLPSKTTSLVTAATTQARESSLAGAISNFAAFYDQVFGARKIQKVYPSLFTAEEMTAPGKANKICRVLETFKNDRGQLKQALQTIINLHRDYSIVHLASLRDIVDGLGFNINDDLSITEKKISSADGDIKEIVKKYHEAIFDEESSSPLPFKACPECGSTNLVGSSCNIQDDLVYTLKCKDCGWSEGQVM